MDNTLSAKDRYSSMDSRVARGTSRYASAKPKSKNKQVDEATEEERDIEKSELLMKRYDAKVGFAIGDKVNVLTGDFAGRKGKVKDCQPYGQYLVEIEGVGLKMVDCRDLEMC